MASLSKCIDKNVYEYISAKLALTPKIKSKNFRIGECVGIGRTTVFTFSGPFFPILNFSELFFPNQAAPDLER